MMDNETLSGGGVVADGQRPAGGEGDGAGAGRGRVVHSLTHLVHLSILWSIHWSIGPFTGPSVHSLVEC